jgi:TnpA family transposase
MRWLYARAWHSAEKPIVLFDLATLRLVERRVLLPGVTTLERLVARIADQAAERLWKRMAGRLRPDQSGDLERLLEYSPDAPVSNLEMLHRSVLRQSGPGLLEALSRYDRLRSLGVGEVDLSAFPLGRIRTLAQQAVVSNPATLRNWSAHHLQATLLAFAWVYETRALDDALDVFDVVITLIRKAAEEQCEAWQQETRQELDAAALRLADVCAVLVDPKVRNVSVRKRAYEVASRDLIEQAIQVIRELTGSPDDRLKRQMVERYRQIVLFLPTLLRTVDFQATRGGQGVLRSLRFIRDHLANLSKADFSNAPQDDISHDWQNRIRDANKQVASRAYVVWAASRLRDGLRRHDIYVSRSERWGNVQLDLIQPDEWQTLRPQVCRALDLSTSGVVEFARFDEELGRLYRKVNATLAENPFVRIENGELVVSPLEAQEEPESLKIAREQVKGRLPWVELLELVLEIAVRTQFPKDFTSILSGTTAEDPDLSLSLCAVLVAEASNVNLGAVAREDHPALTLDRLAFVKQNYIRPETIARANTRLVEAQSGLRLAQVWGGGLVASVDGLRFVVPVKSANALPNRKYFGAERGITLVGLNSDQYTDLNLLIVPGAMRDSPYILECLLEQPTSLRPTEIMSDTASYTDIIFGIFGLLGYQFSPYLADMGDRRFWRIDRDADYGALNKLSRNVVRAEAVLPHWDDFLRVAGSLLLGRVKPMQLMPLFQGGGRASALAKALGEFGRLPKTQHMLNFIDLDENYRRRIRIQLNRHEGRHSLERAIFHGRRGEVREGYREGQGEVLGALGFVANAVVLWNTIYMDAALAHLESQGTPVSEADQERLSPLGFAHINFQGRFSFDLPEIVQQGQLRPLRTPKPTDPIRFAFA